MCFFVDKLNNCRQITFVILIGFCPLSNPPPRHPPVLNGQYKDGQNANHNQQKNICRFYTVQVLEVLLINNL